MDRRSEKKLKKRKKRKKRFIKLLLSMVLMILLVILSYTGYVGYKTYKAANNSYSDLGNEDKTSSLRNAPVHISKDPISILIMGIENYSGKGDKGRSDSLIIATFNPKDESMKMLSIPRDTKVYIPALNRRDKINHAYAYGGKKATIETVEQFLNIPIDYYVKINFKGFINIIDELGGVTVNVPFDFYDINSHWEKFYFKKGKMKLDGEAALVYARMRKKDPRGDFGRNERQQQIVRAVIDKILSPSIIFKIDDIAEEIGRNIETNMSIGEALAFRKKYSDFNSSHIQTLKIEGQDEYVNGVYYFIPDDDDMRKVRKQLREHLNLPSDASSDEEKQSS
jgi:polyisoprenyl-teichoic acid--peptidoglycan teichoic acid transferase